jgi:NAD(P)-dependent dehydrogenase (short-subunit alcohol dehydrogenase family)
MIQTDNERTGDNSLYNYIAQTTPMGRIGKVDEITGAMLYLAAPFASFTTGAIFSIDGGLTSGH